MDQQANSQDRDNRAVVAERIVDVEDSTARSHPFTVRMVFKHPFYDPKQISECMNLEPFRSWKSSDTVTTPRGNVVGGSYGYTMWTWIHPHSEELELRHAIDNMLSRFEEAEDFVVDFTESGGTLALFVNFDGNYYSGTVLEEDSLARMLKLKLRFGFEVFP